MVDQNEAYTFQKRGIFYFSKRVPSDLREFYKVSLEQTHFTYSDYELGVLLSFFDNMYKRMTLYYLSSDFVFKDGLDVEDAVDKATQQINLSVRQ